MSVGPLGANSGEIRITISLQKTSFCVHHSNVWHKLKFERAPNISYLALQISYGMFVINISEWRSGWGSNHTSGWLDWWRLGPVSIQRLPLPGIEVPMLEISRSWYSLIFNMGIPILATTSLYWDGPQTRFYSQTENVYWKLCLNSHDTTKIANREPCYDWMNMEPVGHE